MYLKISSIGPDPIVREADIYKEFIKQHILSFEVDFGFSRPFKRMAVIDALFRETYLFMKKHSFLKRKSEPDNRFKYLDFLLEMTSDITIKQGGEPLLYFGVYISKEYGNIIPTPPLVSEEHHNVEHQKSFAVKHNFSEVWHALSNKREIKNYTRIFRQDYGLPKRYDQEKFIDWVLDNLDIYHTAEIINNNFSREFSNFKRAMYPPVDNRAEETPQQQEETDPQQEFEF